MSHIFISYSKKNADYANALADFLQNHGFNVWIDRIGIEYGVGWWDAIVKGLDACGAFIVVMTPESRDSDWVQREVFIALQDKKPMFPLLYNGENWKVFVLTQYADVRDGSMPDEDLLERLSHYVTPKGKGVNTSDLTPEKQPSPPPEPQFDVDGAIADFGKAFRTGKWSDAQNILGRIRASGEDPTPFDPDEFERRVQEAIEAENRQREQAEYEAERNRQYGRIITMMDYADDETIWGALQKFRQNFPDYDPERIADKVHPQPRSLKLLPAPFEWIDIPAGRVTLGKGYDEKAHGVGQSFDVPAFAIAKYPITNAQFAPFMEAGGYENQIWWTDPGWQQCQKDGWTMPRYWTDKQWNGPEQPVVGVSWYEAIAFCQWLSEASGEQILLPTEQQWQRAAQGDDGREFPWGNDWDCNRCNNSVKPCSSGQTTSVRAYEGKGDSFYGVVDMVGNVWEWCLTEYESGSTESSGNNTRALRGGSWNYNLTDIFRVSYRYGGIPNYRFVNFGFRVSRSY